MTPPSEPELAPLRARARAAQTGSYRPYSDFAVGAAALGPNGALATGANVENASYPVGICAERVAVAALVNNLLADGVEPRLRAVVVASHVQPPASPCGMCRQFMAEFGTPEMPVILLGADDASCVYSLGQLLPASFRLHPPSRSLPPAAPCRPASLAASSAACDRSDTAMEGDRQDEPRTT